MRSPPSSPCPQTSTPTPLLRSPATIDQIADEGRLGAVIFHAPRSPGHAERKRRAREVVFKDVPLAKPDGVYSSLPPRRRRSAASAGTFRVPFKSPLLDRSEGLKRLRTAMTSTLGKTPQVLSHWGVHDPKLAIQKVAREIEAEIATSEPYNDGVMATCEALRLVLSLRGVELVLSGKLENVTDARIQRFNRVAKAFREIKQ